MINRHTSRHVSRHVWLRLACAMAILLGCAAAFAQTPDELEDVLNGDCLDCHTDPALVRTEGVGRFGLLVDPDLFARSVHHGMACVDCHVEQTSVLPHAATRPRLCVDCHHGDDPRAGGVAFGTIERGFRASIHVERAPAVFTCGQCHNPHTFKRDATALGVLVHNQTCQRCHGSEPEFLALVQKVPPDLDKAHKWLPNRDLHWRHVRCLDCHSSYEPLSSHLILPKAKAVKKCEACHSTNSVLNLKLYRYRRAEEVEQVGFLNAAIVNDTYVIGATRNVFLDYGALVAIGATLLGIALHLLLRFWGGRLPKTTSTGASKEEHS